MSDLRAIEKRCISGVLDVLEVRGLGHTGGSLSILQALIALYFRIARVDPGNPKSPERDRIILSKGHACEAMYAVLAEKGFFPKERFGEYLEYGSMLQGHAEVFTPGVEYSGGSLGQGISFGCGIAYAGKLKQRPYHVFALLGDGECHEGSVWEAAMFASHYKLDNLCVMVDYNHYIDHGSIEETMNLEPFVDKWRSFGFETTLVRQGNDVEAICAAYAKLAEHGRPKCLILDTVKNFGVPFWVEKHLHQAFGETLKKGIEEGRRLLSE